MFNAEVFASHLARALYLFRIAAAKDEQKAEFRLLVGMVQEGDVTVRLDSPRVVVNGEGVQGGAVDHLVQRLELHGVSEINVPQDAPVGYIYDLLKALSDQPGGTDDIPPGCMRRAPTGYRSRCRSWCCRRNNRQPFPSEPPGTPLARAGCSGASR